MASLRGLVRKALKYDPLTSAVVKLDKNTPGSVGAAVNAFTAENVSSNPFSENNSRFDMFAGGASLSKNPEARAIGRTVGSFFAGTYGAGALGASGTTATAAGVQAAKMTAENEAANAAKRAANEGSTGAVYGADTPLPTEDQIAARTEAMRRRRIRERAAGSRESTVLTGIPDAQYRNPYVQRKTLLGQG